MPFVSAAMNKTAIRMGLGFRSSRQAEPTTSARDARIIPGSSFVRDDSLFQPDTGTLKAP